MKKIQSKVILILTILLILTGCSNLITELSRVELKGETQVKLATSDEKTILATMVMSDEDKGLDIDSDGVVDAPLVESASKPSSGIYALDFDNDGIVDFYLIVSATETSTLNTNKNGSGTAGTVTFSDDGSFTGIDTDGDGIPNVTTSTNNITTAAATTHSITYNSNGNDTGTAPGDSTMYSTGESITILGNPDNLAEGSNLFYCWNTASDKSGTDYMEGDSIVVGDDDIVLYAIYGDMKYTGPGVFVKGIRYRAIGSTTTMETTGFDETLSGEVTPLTHLMGYDLAGIGSNSFMNCTSITKINIPEGVTRIRDYAFFGCTELKEIDIPSSLLTVNGYNIFMNCSSLTSIALPAAVTELDISAFQNCTNLSTVSIPGIENIGNYAFQNAGLTTIDLPEGLVSLGKQAFYENSNLTSITLPETLTSIGDSAFFNCSSLSSLTIPSAIKIIPGGFTNGCTSLKTVTIKGDDVNIKYQSLHTLVPPWDLYILGENVITTEFGSIPNPSQITLHVKTANLAFYSSISPWNKMIIVDF